MFSNKSISVVSNFFQKGLFKFLKFSMFKRIKSIQNLD
jgi:hypothetical protein